MEANKVYISCPLSVRLNVLDEVNAKLIDMDYETSYWERGSSYHSSNLRESDIVVFILPDNHFDYPIEDLTAGISKELSLSIKNNKRMYIAYKAKTTKNYLMYKAKVDEFEVKGMTGEYLKIFSPKDKVEELNLRGEDNLILLLLG